MQEHAMSASGRSLSLLNGIYLTGTARRSWRDPAGSPKLAFDSNELRAGDLAALFPDGIGLV